MNNINLKKIIIEEINNFDFLNNETDAKYQEYIDLLSNEELQKQFICDSLLPNNKIKIIETTNASIGGDFESNYNDMNNITIEYSVTIEYLYDSSKKPIKFDLDFNSSSINVSASGEYDKGDYYTPPSGDAWFNYIDWNDINVTLFSNDGEEIKFLAFEKAPINIKNLFIKEYVAGFISSKTSMDIRDNSNKSIVSQYC